MCLCLAVAASNRETKLGAMIYLVRIQWTSALATRSSFGWANVCSMWAQSSCLLESFSGVREKLCRFCNKSLALCFLVSPGLWKPQRLTEQCQPVSPSMPSYFNSMSFQQSICWATYGVRFKSKWIIALNIDRWRHMLVKSVCKPTTKQPSNGVTQVICVIAFGRCFGGPMVGAGLVRTGQYVVQTNMPWRNVFNLKVQL